MNQPLFAAADAQVSLVFIELGAAVIGLAVLARLAHRLGFSHQQIAVIRGTATIIVIHYRSAPAPRLSPDTHRT